MVALSRQSPHAMVIQLINTIQTCNLSQQCLHLVQRHLANPIPALLHRPSNISQTLSISQPPTAFQALRDSFDCPHAHPPTLMHCRPFAQAWTQLEHPTHPLHLHVQCTQQAHVYSTSQTPPPHLHIITHLPHPNSKVCLLSQLPAETLQCFQTQHRSILLVVVAMACPSHR